MAKAVAELSVANRQWWRANHYDTLLAPFPAVKCFEISQVMEMIGALAQAAQEKNAVAESVAFLPAPAIWLEFRHDHIRPDNRCVKAIEGYLLVQKDKTSASCTSLLGFETRGGVSFVPIPLADLPLLAASDPDGWALDSTSAQQDLASAPHVPGTPRYDASNVDLDQALLDEQHRAYWLYAALSIINSPKIVDQTTRRASSGLQKRLARKAGAPFELLPWHEILLDVTPPPGGERQAGDGERLTGPKALHFCRAFLRIRLGRLERVRAHWRGDPTLGLSQASYRVTH